MSLLIDSKTNLGSLILRLSLSSVWLAHAALKFFVFGIAGFAAWLASHDLPSFMAWPIFLMEFGAGILILLGFYGRYISLLMLPVLAFALWTSIPNGWMHANPGGGWEYAAFLMAASATHFLIGDGRYALKNAVPSRIYIKGMVAIILSLFLFAPRHSFAADVLQPQDMNQAFADAYNSKNIQQIMKLYTKDAKLVNEDGTVAAGLTQIQKIQTELLKIGGHFTAKNLSTVVVGDTALLNAHWHISTKDKNGKPLELSGFTSEIVKKQPNGTWLYVIDNPFPPKQ